jgi:hypothetical protein
MKTAAGHRKTTCGADDSFTLYPDSNLELSYAS